MIAIMRHKATPVMEAVLMYDLLMAISGLMTR